MGKIAFGFKLKDPFKVVCKKCNGLITIKSLEGEVDDKDVADMIEKAKWLPVHCPNCDEIVFEVKEAKLQDDGKTDDDGKSN